MYVWCLVSPYFSFSLPQPPLPHATQDTTGVQCYDGQDCVASSLLRKTHFLLSSVQAERRVQSDTRLGARHHIEVLPNSFEQAGPVQF